MRYRKLGSSEISISEIGLGCWTLGGLNFENNTIPNGWAPVNRKEIFEAVAYAIEHGINHFDNSDVYGDGRAEKLLSDALGTRINDVIISSKVGYLKNDFEHAYIPQNIKQQCETSLKNLKRERIDIYYFHHANFGVHDQYLDDAVYTMKKLQEQGKIGLIGFSCYSEDDFKRYVPIIQPKVLQSWAHCMDYHFIATNSAVMKLCKQYNCSFVAFSPLNQGILLNKYSSKSPPTFEDGDHRSNSSKFTSNYIERAEIGFKKLRNHFADNTEELVRLALQYVLYHDDVAGVIPGFRTIDQVKMHIAAQKRPLNGNEIGFIRRAFVRSLKPNFNIS